jgi:hypothetical protein
MTDPNPKMALDGYTNSKRSILVEGYVRKGGSNTAASQVKVRPAAPAPMQPSKRQNGGGATPAQGSGTNQGK